MRWSSPYSFEELYDNCQRKYTCALKLKNDLNLPADILALQKDIQYNCPLLFQYLKENGYYQPTKNKYVDFDTLSICIPVVSNIERRRNGGKEILLQTRYKPSIDPENTGKLEIPSGLINRYESAQAAAIRETREETGIYAVLKSEGAANQTVHTDSGDEFITFRPLVCCQQLVGGRSYFMISFVSEYESGNLQENLDENRNPNWVSVDKVREMIEEMPGRFFGLSLVALQEYFKREKL